VFALEKVHEIRINDSVANCGVATNCGAGAFPVHLYTGFENFELPKICVNGIEYVLCYTVWCL